MNVVDNLNSVQVINKPCVCSRTMRLSTFCGLRRDQEHVPSVHFLGGGVQGKCFLLITFKNEKNLIFRNVRSIYIVKKGEQVKIIFFYFSIYLKIFDMVRFLEQQKKIFSIQSAFCSLIALKLKISCKKKRQKVRLLFHMLVKLLMSIDCKFLY